MQDDTILYLSDLDTPISQTHGAISKAASFGAQVIVFIHATSPTLPLNLHGALPFGGAGEAEIWAREIKATETALEKQSAAVKALLQQEGCRGEVRPLISAEADIQEVVAESAKYSDYVYLAPSLKDKIGLMKDLAHGVIFDSPVGLFVNADVGPRFEHVLIAWNDSVNVARAVHLALPFLKRTTQVTIACFDPLPFSRGHPYEPGAALSNWLAGHGCNVEIAQYPSGENDIATCILARSKELGADLVVAGAYSHSRMRQAVFGGTTRSLLEQGSQAVFFAH